MSKKPKGQFVNGKYRVFRPSAREIATARDFNAPLGANGNGETARPSERFHAPNHAPIERRKGFNSDNEWNGGSENQDEENA